MANRGSILVPSKRRPGYRLRLDWAITGASVPNNSTTVRGDLYLDTLPGWDLASSAPSAGHVTINGNKKNFSALSTVGGGKAKLLASHTVTIPHNSDGTKTFTMAFNYNIPNVIQGAIVGLIDSGTRSAVLDPIPREASIISGMGNLQFGHPYSITVTKYSPAFVHDVKLEIRLGNTGWTHIKTKTNENTSIAFGLTQADFSKILTTVDYGDGGRARVTLTTKTKVNGSVVGTTSKEVAIIVEGRNAASSTTKTMTIGEKATITNDRDKGIYKTVILLKDGDTVIAKSGQLMAGQTFLFDTAPLQAQILNAMGPNRNSIYLNIETETRYIGMADNAPLVKKVPYSNSGITVFAKDAPPKFNPVSINTSIVDTNPVSVAVTGGSFIVQDLSDMRIVIPVNELAIPQNNATMKEYTVTVSGKAVTLPHIAGAPVTFNLGKVQAFGNQTVTIKAVDSRGQSTIYNRTINITKYKKPRIYSPRAQRQNGFGKILSIGYASDYGSVSGKNQILTSMFRYYDPVAKKWSNWETMPFGINGESVVSKPLTLASNPLDPSGQKEFKDTLSYKFEFRVKDKFNNEHIGSTIVPEGRPIMFIDKNRKAIGINKFPQADGLEVDGNIYLENGRLQTDRNKFASVGGSLNLRNSDIVGVNGIFLGNTEAGGTDPSDGIEEGINFPVPGYVIPKGGVFPDSQIGNDKYWDGLRINDKRLYVNSTIVGHAKQGQVLWQGAYYMQEEQVINLPVKMRDMPNGLMLLWKRYASGATKNYHANWTFVHKSSVIDGFHTGGYSHPLSMIANNTTKNLMKFIIHEDSRIVGHGDNIKNGAEEFVLTRVVMF